MGPGPHSRRRQLTEDLYFFVDGAPCFKKLKAAGTGVTLTGLFLKTFLPFKATFLFPSIQDVFFFRFRNRFFRGSFFRCSFRCSFFRGSFFRCRCSQWDGHSHLRRRGGRKWARSRR